MADNFRFAQLQPFSLAGAGAVIGATSITLQSMLDIDGNTLTMAGTFGTKGYGTLEPGNGSLEEQISFTGFTNNSNGTVTLSGVSNVGFEYPYTETSGLLKTHAGATTFVISNTSGFYDKLTSKNDDETIAGTWTFTNPNYPRMDTENPFPTDNQQLVTKAYADSLAIAGAPNASLTQKGIVQVATQAQVDAKTVIGSTSAYLMQSLDTQRSTLLNDYVVDTGSPNVIKIAPSPAITSYTAGQTFVFKMLNTNTSPTVSINVNGLGAKNVSKLDGATSPAASDMVAGQVLTVVYDGVNMQMQSPPANFIPPGVITMYGGSSAPLGYLLCNGSPVSRTTYANLFTVVGTSFGTGDGTTTFNVPAMGGRFIAGPSAFLSSTIGATGGASTVASGPYSVSTTSTAFSGGGGSGIVAFTGTNPTVVNTTSASLSIIPPYMITNYIIKT